MQPAAAPAEQHGNGDSMPDPALSLLPTPPAKNAPPTPENARLLQAWLDSITAYRATTAGRPWTFYEQLDNYLGPWGESGYPIAYGKKYCMLFSSDRRLNSDQAGRIWVRRTLILLQEAIKAEGDAQVPPTQPRAHEGVRAAQGCIR